MKTEEKTKAVRWPTQDEVFKVESLFLESGRDGFSKEDINLLDEIFEAYDEDRDISEEKFERLNELWES